MAVTKVQTGPIDDGQFSRQADNVPSRRGSLRGHKITRSKDLTSKEGKELPSKFAPDMAVKGKRMSLSPATRRASVLGKGKKPVEGQELAYSAVDIGKDKVKITRVVNKLPKAKKVPETKVLPAEPKLKAELFTEGQISKEKVDVDLVKIHRPRSVSITYEVPPIEMTEDHIESDLKVEDIDESEKL